MARTIDYWYNQIIASKNSKPELDQLNSTSKVAIYNLFAYIVAVVIASLDNLFDFHKAEIDELIKKEKAHSLLWYREKSLAYQHGQALEPDTDQYDNTGLSDAQIEERQIIKQSAVTAVDGRLRIKVVTESDGKYEQLDEEQLNSFKTYMDTVKDAGERITCESLPPDQLKLVLDIFYDPLVLRADGSRIDGADLRPVPKTVQAFLKDLPFNGEYANTRLTDVLQRVDGVVLPVIKSSQAKYGLFPFQTIDERYIPDAGFLELIEDNPTTPGNLIINYREYV